MYVYIYIYIYVLYWYSCLHTFHLQYSQLKFTRIFPLWSEVQSWDVNFCLISKVSWRHYLERLRPEQEYLGRALQGLTFKHVHGITNFRRILWRIWIPERTPIHKFLFSKPPEKVWAHRSVRDDMLIANKFCHPGEIGRLKNKDTKNDPQMIESTFIFVRHVMHCHKWK